jgi:hypothetical protein
MKALNSMQGDKGLPTVVCDFCACQDASPQADLQTRQTGNSAEQMHQWHYSIVWGGAYFLLCHVNIRLKMSELPEDVPVQDK